MVLWGGENDTKRESICMSEGASYNVICGQGGDVAVDFVRVSYHQYRFGKPFQLLLLPSVWVVVAVIDVSWGFVVVFFGSRWC